MFDLRFLDSLRRHGRLVTALLVAAAVVAGVNAMRPAAAPSVRIWVATRTLPGGRPLVRGDVSLTGVEVRDVPTGALGARASPVGQTLAAPIRRGEPLTDVRLLEPALLSVVAPGSVATSVRIADGPATTALVHAGQRIDVLAASADADLAGNSATIGAANAAAAPARATTIARDLAVLTTPAMSPDDSSDSDALVIVAAAPAQAAVIASAEADGEQLTAIVDAG